MDVITHQQRLVLDSQQRRAETIDRTGEHLDNKAMSILQAGGLIVAIAGATTLPAFVASITSPWMLSGVAVGFVLFIAMVYCALKAWSPTSHEIAGPSDWDAAFDDYISKEVDDAYNQVLSDIMAVADHNKATNERKAKYVQAAGWLLAGQVAAILILSVAVAYLQR